MEGTVQAAEHIDHRAQQSSTEALLSYGWAARAQTIPIVASNVGRSSGLPVALWPVQSPALLISTTAAGAVQQVLSQLCAAVRGIGTTTVPNEPVPVKGHLVLDQVQSFRHRCSSIQSAREYGQSLFML